MVIFYKFCICYFFTIQNRMIAIKDNYVRRGIMKKSLLLGFIILAAFVFLFMQWTGASGKYENKSLAAGEEYTYPHPKLPAL